MAAENTIILRLDNMSKSLAKVKHDEVTRALNEMSLSMKNGEFISLMGPSGCGKSTMLRLVVGLAPPITDHLTVNGTQITGPSSERGVVSQKPALFPWLTVERNISFNLKLQGKLKGSEEKIERMLKIIGFESFRSDYPSQFSGDMVQRVSLVRSLISEPDILLLDEPPGAPNVLTHINMQDEILKVWREKEQLAIVATHDVDGVICVGTRVIVMDVHPGGAVFDIRIDQAHPRERLSQAFVACWNEILNRLHFGGRNSDQR